MAVQTQLQHGFDYIKSATVQVGGDGLFQEIMNGLLDLRSQGSQMAALAAGMRLGHIPAGSTDAVAYSIHGTRSQLTAALHIALGDRSVSACLPAWLAQIMAGVTASEKTTLIRVWMG